jgi:hypothetical protein
MCMQLVSDEEFDPVCMLTLNSTWNRTRVVGTLTQSDRAKNWWGIHWGLTMLFRGSNVDLRLLRLIKLTRLRRRKHPVHMFHCDCSHRGAPELDQGHV